MWAYVQREQKILIMLEYLMKNSGLFGRKDQKSSGSVDGEEKHHIHVGKLIKLDEINFQINLSPRWIQGRNNESTETVHLPKS